MKKYSLMTLALLLPFSASFAADFEPISPTVYSIVQIADLADEDSDGVINGRDLCPKTPLNAKTDNNGCEQFVDIENRLSLLILFPNDSTKVAKIFQDDIKEMVDFMKINPELGVNINGFASTVGAEEYNKALSERRAKKIKSAMVDQGINEKRIAIIGHGETAAFDTGNKSQLEAGNRKVTATLGVMDKDYIKKWNLYSNNY